MYTVIMVNHFLSILTQESKYQPAPVIDVAVGVFPCVTINLHYIASKLFGCHMSSLTTINYPYYVMSSCWLLLAAFADLDGLAGGGTPRRSARLEKDNPHVKLKCLKIIKHVTWLQ